MGSEYAKASISRSNAQSVLLASAFGSRHVFRNLIPLEVQAASGLPVFPEALL